MAVVDEMANVAVVASIDFSILAIQNFDENIHSCKILDKFFPEILISERCKGMYILYSSKNAENAATLTIVAVHTAENEPPRVCIISFHRFNWLLSAAICASALTAIFRT